MAGGQRGGVCAAGGAAIEAALPQYEANGWRLSDAVQRIWAGERELATLTAGLDASDTHLIARVLELVTDDAAYAAAQAAA